MKRSQLRKIIIEELEKEGVSSKVTKGALKATGKIAKGRIKSVAWWWKTLSDEQKRKYLLKHPKSKLRL